jgi:hypothetical protein
LATTVDGYDIVQNVHPYDVCVAQTHPGESSFAAGRLVGRNARMHPRHPATGTQAA